LQKTNLGLLYKDMSDKQINVSLPPAEYMALLAARSKVEQKNQKTIHLTELIREAVNTSVKNILKEPS
jgi:hypothetical protein